MRPGFKGDRNFGGGRNVKTPSIRSIAERDNEGAFILEEDYGFIYPKIKRLFSAFLRIPPGC